MPEEEVKLVHLMELSVFVLSILKVIDCQISLFIPEICQVVGGNIYFDLASR